VVKSVSQLPLRDLASGYYRKGVTGDSFAICFWLVLVIWTTDATPDLVIEEAMLEGMHVDNMGAVLQNKLMELMGAIQPHA
jgi:hypothetical protein